MVTTPSGEVPAQVKRSWMELPEALLVLGIAALILGVWMIYHPAALILFGLICIAASGHVFGWFRRSKPRKD